MDCLPSRGGGCCNPAASSSIAPAPSASVPILLRGPARSSSVPSTSAAPVPRVPLPGPLSNTIRPAPTQVSALTGSPSISVSARAVNQGCRSLPPPLPSLESVLRVRISTLRHVPKVCRAGWAGVVGGVFQAICADPSNVDAWVKLFMLARCILANPSRGGRSHWREIQRTVQSRISFWKEGKFHVLWDDVLAANRQLTQRLARPHPNSPSNTPSSVPNPQQVRRARRAVEDGQYRKAIQYLSSAGIAHSTTDVLNAMLSQSVPPPVPNSPTPSSISVSESDIVRALHSFPCGTAPGPSCLRATHLKEAVFCSSPVLSTRALKGLHGIVNLLCAGQVPNCVVPHLCGATLLRKTAASVPLLLGRYCVV